MCIKIDATHKNNDIINNNVGKILVESIVTVKVLSLIKYRVILQNKGLYVREKRTFRSLASFGADKM